MKLCKRTLCAWKAGEPLEGFMCKYVYTGAVPCTGPRRCRFCNEVEPEEMDTIGEVEMIVAKALHEHEGVFEEIQPWERMWGEVAVKAILAAGYKIVKED